MKKTSSPQETKTFFENLSRLSAAIGLVALVFGQVLNSRNARLALAVVAVAFLFLPLRGLLRSLRNDGIGTVSRLVQRNTDALLHENGFCLETADLRSDVRRVADFERTFFPEDAFDPERVIQMWNRYKSGITFASDVADGSIVSFVAIWPIETAVYEELKLGIRDESNIWPSDIVATGNREHWWIGCVATREDIRKQHSWLTATVLMKAIRDWETHIGYSKDIGLITSAFTKSGAKLAERLGMAKTPGKTYPMYHFEGNPVRISGRMIQTLELPRVASIPPIAE